MERTEKIKEKGDLGLSFGSGTPHPVKRTPSFYGMELRARMFPFTAEQWQELQRQAMIYKHMVASVPIPTDLLFPGPPTIYLPPPPSMVRGGGGMSLVRLANGADPEPGRCRRTDGKKWRCARDAAPDQRYCERHLNRGRPRSRKPVEPRRTARSRIPTRAAACTGVKASSEPDDTLVPNVGLNLDPFRSAEPRCEEWMKSYSEGSTSREQCEMTHPKIGLKYGANPAMRHYEELPNLNYSETSGWYPFLSSNLSSLEESDAADYIEPPRRFFDAWSSENSKQRLSTLTLSISNDIEEATEEIHDDIKSGQLNWMASNSPLGGPLAEVLHSSNLKSQESSPRDSPSRLVSSPSGVLQKPLVSLSDSSRSSSPTFAAASRSEFALYWMNLNN